MAYNLGSPVYIAALSNCKDKTTAVNLYAPMEVSYAVNQANRTYTITVNLYCRFSLDMNINMSFKGLSIGGVGKDDKRVSGWVYNRQPGALLASQQFTGYFNSDGTPNQRNWSFGASGYITPWTNIACTVSKRYNFSNSISVSISDIDPTYTVPDTPTISMQYAGNVSLTGSMATTSFGVGGGNKLYTQASRYSDFSNVIATSNTVSSLQGTWTVNGLAQNTRYYLRSVARNNGYSAASNVISAVTLTESEITGITPISSTSVKVDAFVYHGGGEYTVTTYIETSTDGTNWTIRDTTEQEAEYSKVITGLVSGTEYMVRVRSVTSAGEYTSKYTTVATPTHIVGSIESIENVDGNAVVTITATSDECDDMEGKVYYRISGISDAWEEGPSVEFTSGSTAETIITGLSLNYVNYDVYVHLSDCAGNEFDTKPYKYVTSEGPVENHTCESLSFMVSLICQSYRTWTSGNINVFMNDDTKAWCDEADDETPTMFSLMTRIQRYMHAIGCVLCSMEGMMEVSKPSMPNQVFAGKMGWTAIDEEIEEFSSNLASSGACYERIESLVDNVWHYIGSINAIALSEDEMDAQKALFDDGDEIVFGDKVYVLASGDWVENRDFPVENFGVVHVNNGAHSDKGMFWFGERWRQLDFDDSEINARLVALEASVPVVGIEGQEFKVAFASIDDPYEEILADIPTDPTKDTVIFILKEVEE